MEIEKIAGADWKNQEAPTSLAQIVQDILEDSVVTPAAPWSTTRLLDAIMPKRSTEQNKRIVAHLQTARSKGLLDGFFARDEKRKTFGKALVLWAVQPRVEMTIDERIKQVAADLGLSVDEYKTMIDNARKNP